VIEALADTPLLAFAGIGRPARFFASIEAIGGQIAKKLSFADHHPYSQQDLARIQEDAQRHGAEMITTQKDWMRLPADWRGRITMLPVSVDMRDEAAFLDAIESRLAAAGHGDIVNG
jgi:tetraacyldisaccharide 4'-kinase